MDFYCGYINFFKAYPWILGGLACMIFVLGRIESTTLSLWRNTTGKDEKWFPIESRTLKERFLGDFVGGGDLVNWVGQSSYLGEEIESQKIKIKIKHKKLGRRSWSFAKFWSGCLCSKANNESMETITWLICLWELHHQMASMETYVGW